MAEHRIDYGSVQIDYHEPADGSARRWVEVRARCVCGVVLIGQGDTFVEASRQLDAEIDRHQAEMGAGGQPGSPRGQQ